MTFVLFALFSGWFPARWHFRPSHAGPWFLHFKSIWNQRLYSGKGELRNALQGGVGGVLAVKTGYNRSDERTKLPAVRWLWFKLSSSIFSHNLEDIPDSTVTTALCLLYSADFPPQRPSNRFSLSFFLSCFLSYWHRSHWNVVTVRSVNWELSCFFLL